MRFFEGWWERLPRATLLAIGLFILNVVQAFAARRFDHYWE